MQVIFQSLYGSRLFGTFTENSDRDIKYIYLPELKSLVLGHSIKNVFVTTNDQTKNTKDDTDTEYVSVQSFFWDLFENKNYALDLYMCMLHQITFDSIHPGIQNFAEQQFSKNPLWLYDKFETMLLEFRSRFLNSNVAPILGFAISQANRYQERSQRLICINKLYDYFKDIKPKEWVKNTSFEKVLKECDPEEFYLGTYLADKVRNTWMPCIYVMESVIPLSTSVEKALEVINAKQKKYGQRVQNASNGTDWRSLHHAIRSGYTCCHYLKNGEYSMPFTGDELTNLMKIKKGESTLEDVRDELNLLISQIHLLQKKPHPSLKQHSEQLHAEFTNWLSNHLVDIYKQI